MEYSQRQREERLAAMLRSRYGVDACAIVPASRGFYGETWQVRAGGERYFLKVDALPFHQARFRCGLAAVDYFCSRGIAFAGRVIPAKDGALWARWDGATAGLFAWIDCRQQETDGTKAAEYRMLCQIYRLTRPGLSIPRASLSDASARRFYGLWAALARAPAHRQAVPFWQCWPATASPWPAGASHTRLHPELLAFYTCHMYFHYLAEFLLTHPLRDQSQAPADFFAPGQWLEERLRFADTVCP